MKIKNKFHPYIFLFLVVLISGGCAERQLVELTPLPEYPKNSNKYKNDSVCYVDMYRDISPGNAQASKYINEYLQKYNYKLADSSSVNVKNYRKNIDKMIFALSCQVRKSPFDEYVYRPEEKNRDDKLKVTPCSAADAKLVVLIKDCSGNSGQQQNIYFRAWGRHVAKGPDSADTSLAIRNAVENLFQIDQFRKALEKSAPNTPAGGSVGK